MTILERELGDAGFVVLAEGFRRSCGRIVPSSRARAADLDRDCARAHAQNHRRVLGDLFQLVVKRALKDADVKDSLAQGDWR